MASCPCYRTETGHQQWTAGGAAWQGPAAVRLWCYVLARLLLLVCAVWMVLCRLQGGLHSWIQRPPGPLLPAEYTGWQQQQGR